MNHIGISAGYHDSAISVVSDTGDIMYAAHSERSSKIKHDRHLDNNTVIDALSYATDNIITVNYYERPILKYLRQLYSGEYNSLKNLTVANIIGSHNMITLNNYNNYDYFNLQIDAFASARHYRTLSVKTHCHHLSHAAGGFQTSSFDRATIVVIDAIGEWDTISIWGAHYDHTGLAKYRRLYTQRYPNSIGLFYSAMTRRVGLRPLDEEYILMGMAAWGTGRDTSDIIRDRLLLNSVDATFKRNLHCGVDNNFLSEHCDYDIASGTQTIVEELIQQVMNRARNFNYSENLVYSGGVALNCTANRLLGNYFDNIWIMPNPGDAGSSLGAAALSYGKRLNWVNAYLGYNINRSYPVESALDQLLRNQIVGVATGRAEFGPRALGNRSLLADPRGNDIKDRVNDIKQRQRFRPFAPVILEEHVNDYFILPPNWSESRYMQTVATCRRPELFPAVIHIDGTSRVQTVPKDNSGIRRLLDAWYDKTGCPMLLNTSLNVRGEPMVNTVEDAERFSKLYNIPVVT